MYTFIKKLYQDLLTVQKKKKKRLLKMDRRLTLGIGDNREHCFYIAVGFHLIRLYIDQGFELEELVKRKINLVAIIT